MASGPSWQERHLELPLVTGSPRWTIPGSSRGELDRSDAVQIGPHSRTRTGSLGKPVVVMVGGQKMNEEGWFVDPFGHHEARWISDGTPTALVRNGRCESQDPPPTTTIEGPLERLAETTERSGDDLRRADDAESQSLDPVKMTDAAEESIDSSW